MNGENAVAQSVVGMVAGVVFALSAAVLLIFVTISPVPSNDAEVAVLENRAASIAAMLTTSPGVGMDDNASTYQRFSLMTADGKHLNPEVASQFCNAGGAKDSDTAIDYNRVMHSLDLPSDDGIQFHISITPAELPTFSFSDLKTGYIGHIEPQTDLVAPGISTAGFSYGTGYTYPGGNYVQQLDSHFSATALSERNTVQDMGVDHKPMPDAYGSSMEGSVELVPGQPEPASSIFAEDILHGDQYFDDKKYLEETLANRLHVYELMIVGTDVDHKELSPLTEVVVDWVHGGGKLLIMGTQDGQGQSDSPPWLQDLMAAADPVDGVDDGPSWVDHPVFSSYHSLSAEEFVGSARFQMQSGSVMENLIPAQTDSWSYLSMNRCGTFGSGNVARLSSTDSDKITYDDYQPDCVVDPNRQLTGDLGPCVDKNEAGYGAGGNTRKLLENLVVYGEQRDLYLDLGPSVPSDNPVAHDMRIIAYDHPSNGDTAMEVHIYVWGT